MKRREFIAMAGASACFGIGYAATMPRTCGKGRRIRMALVGCGNRGVNFALQEMAKEQIVAIADPDSRRIKAAFEKIRKIDPSIDVSKIRSFADYREMFDKASGEIDAVVIASMNSHHALPALMAMRRGIHVYVEKPMALTVEEVHAMHAAAKRYGVVTQVGNQGHSTDGIRLAADYAAAGMYGDVRDVWCWCGRMHSRTSRPPKAAPPAGLDWDLWCGGSPVCDWYAADEMYPELSRHDWHNWIGYGNGTVGNWGPHILDTPVFMLGLDRTPPVSVETKEVAWGVAGAWQMRCRVDFRFPARGKAPPVTVHWYEGMRDGTPIDKAHYEGFYGVIRRREDQFFPPEVAEAEARHKTEKNKSPFGVAGAMIRIDGGVVTFGPWGAPPKFWPDKPGVALPKPPQAFERVRGSHFGDFCAAIREGRKSSADFDYSAPLGDLVALVNAAPRAGCRDLKWDGSRFAGDEKASEFLSMRYRKGWEIQ